MIRILCIFGTRPEAIKLCPLVRQLRACDGFSVKVCVTAQHRGMLDQVLETFAVRPDYDLDLMRPGQSLPSLTANILSALEPVLSSDGADLVIVQGDTTTTMAAGLVAFYHQIPLAHVEAGLRTGDMTQPFPEEMNRVIMGRLATLHFAPTARAATALRAEGVPESRIEITGNTGIDAVLFVRDALDGGTVSAPEWPWLDRQRKLLLVTSHRRESFGAGLRETLGALRSLAARDDVQIVYPVHRNPNVLGPVQELIGGFRNIILLDPLPYVPFVDLMRQSYVILTDSGGIQEEAPSLGKPVLVLRDKTERPEAIEAGTVRLVGTSGPRIVCAATELLDDSDRYRAMTCVHNPYGDGYACRRIAAAIAAHFHGSGTSGAASGRNGHRRDGLE